MSTLNLLDEVADWPPKTWQPAIVPTSAPTSQPSALEVPVATQPQSEGLSSRHERATVRGVLYFVTCAARLTWSSVDV